MKLVNTLILSTAAVSLALALAACGTSEKKAATEHPTSSEHPAATPPAADAPAADAPAATPPAADPAAAPK